MPKLFNFTRLLRKYSCEFGLLRPSSEANMWAATGGLWRSRSRKQEQGPSFPCPRSVSRIPAGPIRKGTVSSMCRAPLPDALEGAKVQYRGKPV